MQEKEEERHKVRTVLGIQRSQNHHWWRERRQRRETGNVHRTIIGKREKRAYRDALAKKYNRKRTRDNCKVINELHHYVIVMPAMSVMCEMHILLCAVRFVHTHTHTYDHWKCGVESAETYSEITCFSHMVWSILPSVLDRGKAAATAVVAVQLLHLRWVRLATRVKCETFIVCIRNFLSESHCAKFRFNFLTWARIAVNHNHRDMRMRGRGVGGRQKRVTTHAPC